MKPRYANAAVKRTSAMTSFVVALVVLTIAAGCSSKSPSKSAGEQGEKAKAAQNPAAAQSSSNPGIDLQCVMERIQNPSESFHYFYKKDSSNPVHQEADVTPQSIDGFRVDISGQQQPIHAERSDPQNWQSAWSGLMGISGMSSAIAVVNHGSAMKREGDGADVNGYKTIHYSIDTARFDATERRLLGSTMGPGGFEKGDAWVTSQGCPVKLVLDDEMHNRDGSLLENIHYEEAIVKK
jgi:hypothetical protein